MVTMRAFIGTLFQSMLETAKPNVFSEPWKYLFTPKVFIANGTFVAAFWIGAFLVGFTAGYFFVKCETDHKFLKPIVSPAPPSCSTTQAVISALHK